MGLTELTFLPPVLLLSHERPIKAIINAVNAFETRFSVRRLSEKRQEIIPIQDKIIYLRHRFALEPNDQGSVLYIEPYNLGEMTPALVTELGEKILAPEPIVVFLGHSRRGNRPFVAITSNLNEDAMLVHSVLFTSRR